MNEGILYIATGEQFVETARQSAESVIKLRPDLPIAICTDQPDPGPPFDIHLPINDPVYANSDKCRNIHRSPFDRTIYLDTDTYICDDRFFEDIFAVLDQFDLASTTDVGRRHDLQYNDSYTNFAEVQAPGSFPWLNTGLLAFCDNGRVSKLFSDWVATHDRHRRNFRTTKLENEPDYVMGQPAFREALFNSDVRYAVLPMEYNCRVEFGHYLIGEVKMIHGGISNYAEVAAKLNRTTGPRIFRTLTVHNEGVVQIQNLKPGGLERKLRILWLALRRHGIRDTMRSLIRWACGEGFNRS